MTVDYRNYGIFLTMGNAGFISSEAAALGRLWSVIGPALD